MLCQGRCGAYKRRKCRKRQVEWLNSRKNIIFVPSSLSITFGGGEEAFKNRTMKHILEYRKLFNVTEDVDLASLKTAYRNLIKEWHPDKFAEDHEKKAEAELKSQNIIEAYHFLVSIAEETHALNKEEYEQTITTSGIDDFIYKAQRLKITFQDGSVYEYFGVPKNIYNKLLSSSALPRFARRHIFGTYLYRNVSKQTATVE